MTEHVIRVWLNHSSFELVAIFRHIAATEVRCKMY